MSTTDLVLNPSPSERVAAPAEGLGTDGRRLLTLYTNAVMALGATFLALGAPALALADPAWFAALAILAVSASLFKLSLQLPGGGATMTLGYAPGFLGLLSIGPHPTAIVVLLGIWTQCTYRLARKTPMDMRRRLFSMACGVITVEAAGWAFAAVGGVPGGALR